MLHKQPRTLASLNALLGEDVFQLISVEGDLEQQLIDLEKIAVELQKEFTSVNFYISYNPHELGDYYGLEVPDSMLENGLENNTYVIADRLNIEY